MKRNLTFRYELNLNQLQYSLVCKHAGIARFAYNWGLERRKKLYEEQGKYTNAIEQHKLLNSLKQTEYSWMYEVSKCAPQEALRDLDTAFKNFFRGLKEKQPIGFPKFKRKGNSESFRLTGTIKVNPRSIQLPRLGVLRLKEQTQVEGRILSATVVQEADRWYVCITVEQDWTPPKSPEGEAVGIDVGLTSFAILSTGEKIEAPKPLAKKLQRLQRLSKQHSKKVKGSKNRKKSALRLSRLHRKIGNTRRDFLHQTTTKLARTKSAIVIEDLDVKGLLGKGLSRQISDAGWGEFRRLLDYKTKWYGSKLIVAPRFFPSTKTCSHCEHRLEKLSLFTRQWTCPCCGMEHDRDINAAQNLLKYSTGSSPGIHACGDASDGASAKLASHVSLKQELTNGTFVHKL